MTHPAPLPRPLVSTDWLADALGRPGLVVIDASWYLPHQGRDAIAEFHAGHIPAARFFDLDATSDPESDLPHMLPTPEHFATAMSALGIDAGSDVVVCDDSGTQLSAPRLWWMLRVFGHESVAVLDGGLGAWRREGRPLEAGAAASATGVKFHSRFRPELVRSRTEVAGVLAAGAAQIGDARGEGRFRGTVAEPRPGLQSGHIPGTCNLPFTDLVDSGTGRYWPPDELARRFQPAGLRLDTPTITLCGSGVTACSLALAMQVAGAEEVAVYDGSWAEWGRDGIVESG
ncbi:MAG: 3-mercaptopyruvate sulfurtransferase [Gemmatimonadota bacterium]|nr:3-mercaptopyruvate sulfurtransferase [Gemmatimonadota bacterium]